MVSRPRVRITLNDARPTPHPKNRHTLTILDAIADPHLFAPWFTSRTSWASWAAFLAALFGLALNSEQLAIYQKCTGRHEPPT